MGTHPAQEIPGFFLTPVAGDSVLRLSPPQPQCADQWHLECTGAELYSVLSREAFK